MLQSVTFPLKASHWFHISVRTALGDLPSEKGHPGSGSREVQAMHTMLTHHCVAMPSVPLGRGYPSKSLEELLFPFHLFFTQQAQGAFQFQPDQFKVRVEAKEDKAVAPGTNTASELFACH